MQKILITGASGFLGSNFCREYAAAFQITGVYQQHPFQMEGVDSRQANLAEPDEVYRLLDESRPDGIIHLAALSDPNACEVQPELSEKFNIEATEILAEAAAERKIPFLFSSTDLVFDGKQAPYSERDLPNPISVYGMHKAIAEQAVMDIHPLAVVCRLPLMYGIPYGTGQSFLQGMLRKLLAGEPLALFTDEYRTPASGRNVCEGLLICLQKGEGVYHLGGPESISRYMMGQMLCSILGLDESRLKKSRQKDVTMPARRPKDVSLNSEKAVALGWQQARMEDELKDLVVNGALLQIGV